MPTRPRGPLSVGPLALPDRLLAILCRKWACPLLTVLMEGPKRFRELERLIPGLKRGVLASELRRLTQEGLVQRREVSTKPRQVSYTLGPAGASLCELLTDLRAWESRHLPPASPSPDTAGQPKMST